uniref:protein dachsous-like n=1 Tax=Styela clava TaxID=7725 RepID=UPI0019393D37|nr:protein dachsous-like [Styela clava]
MRMRETYLMIFEKCDRMNRKRWRWRTSPVNFDPVMLTSRSICKYRDFNFSMILFLLLFACDILQSTKVSANILSFNISENLPTQTQVGIINGGISSYFIAEKTKGVNDAFDVSKIEGTGTIITIAELNRENIEQYNMTLYDSMNDVSYKVTVNILDVNDNSPTFAQEKISLEISELAKIGSEFNLGSALDEDAPPFNVLGYRLVEASEYFDVNTTELKDESTRFAELVVIKQLDRETTPYHIVKIEAYDGGTPEPNTGRITVNVSVSDSNDNSPVFVLSTYNATVSEGDNVGSDVITVKATDRDAGVNGDITYSIDREKSDPDELFRINPGTGRIYINKKLDSESETQHRLTVLATDGGAQAQVGSTLVIIYVEDVNDNQPTINIIFLGSNDGKVSEGAEIGDYIARISVSDPDVGDVEKFNVTMTGGEGRFGLKTDNGVVYLVRVEERLDREEKAFYDILLNATDFGSPPKSASASFTIEVEDINDNPPRFDQNTYVVDISEESFPGTFVIHLAATDLDLGINKKFEYSLLESDQSNWFDLHRESGLITTSDYLDHELNPEPRLTIVATDFGIPRLSSSTTVVIRIGNANDTAPKFQSSTYRKTIPENMEEGSCLLQVKAIDPDYPSQEGQIVYTIFSDSVQPDKINLNPSTGEICINKELDRETKSSYQFRVKATDKSGQHDFAQVYVEISDINDNRPEFHPVEYVANVAAATSMAGNPLTQVIATDADDSSEDGNRYGIIVYEVVTGNNQKLFSLNNETGYISIAKPLAAYGNTVIQLRIRATDGGGKSSDRDATVTISILNDTVESTDGPVFDKQVYQFDVDEDEKHGTRIGNIAASSPDDISYYIRSDPPMSSWFSVDTKTGDITVASSIDREIFSEVNLQIMASAGSPPVYGFSTMIITINDINDNSPVFTDQNPFLDHDVIKSVTIPYSWNTQSPIYTVKASDSDAQNNALIRFSLIDDAGHFSINMNSGEIKLRSSLPQENRNYSVLVQASDHGNPPKSTSGTVVIQALRPDGSCPTFSSNIYSISIPEDTDLAISFRTVSATPSAGIVYRLVPSVDSFTFGVYWDGSLYLTTKLDREVKDRYQFELMAEGSQSLDFTTPCVAMTTIDITVTDVNDNVPYFDLESTRFSIQENMPKGSKVGVVTAVDNDIGKNSDLRYSFATENPYFQIDSVSGEITTTQQLDHESASSHLLTIQARDLSESPLMSQVSIRVYIEDQNDNSPKFLYQFAPVLSVVVEKQPKGTFISQLQATDKDIGNNGLIKYSILSGADNNLQIASDTGRVTTSKQLTAGNSYSLTIEAKDQGSTLRSSTISLEVKVIQSTENRALVEENSYVFYAASETKPGDVLGSFETKALTTRVARDVHNGNVLLANFRITEGNEYDVFYLNQNNGELSTTKELNYEMMPQYKITVTAENSVKPDDIYTMSAQINIEDENDYSPVFTTASYSIPVQENIAKNTKIWKFTAVDNDIGENGEITYSILNQTASIGKNPQTLSQNQFFYIDSYTGELYTKAEMDRETIPSYTLVIKATDGSSTNPRFTTVSALVTIQDMNDKWPRFLSRSDVFILEDEPVKFPVITVLAEDDDLGPNSHVIYSIIRQWDMNGKEDESFQINSKTGLITLVRRLNYEMSTTHYVNISATDSSAIDPLTSHQLLVVNVVDVNDESPKFSRDLYFAEIEENQITGSLVTKVTATDGDSGENGKVTYELHDKSDSFKINQDTGVVVTTKQLDRENIESYSLTVYAHDGAFPSLYTWCTIHLTVLDTNDNSPDFAIDGDAVYTDAGSLILGTIEIPEYEPGPALVYTVIASDLDSGRNGEIFYSIQDGNTDNSFTMNSTTGELWTTKRLDREQTSSYRLKIVATDNASQPRSSDAVLDITVLDWNDENPIFTELSYHAEISEGLPLGQFVLTVHADDADSGLNGKITYSIDPGTRENQEPSSTAPEGLFSIDPETGVITTTAILDREKKSSHQIIVQAIDSAPYGPRKTSVTVNIDVLDINDNHPIFTDTLIIKNVSASISIGSDITTLSAQDKDDGDNGTVFYRITGGKTAPFGSSINKFQIDNNGQITTTFALSGAYTYYLNITASDNGIPPHTSDAVVIVNVVPFDIPNFSQVLFQKPIYQVDMHENTQKDSRVTQVRAKLFEDGKEVEDESSVNIMYDFASGNEDKTFVIDNDGVITVKDPSMLDFESLPEIRLIVYAAAVPTNGAISGPMYAHSTVIVNLLDDNDNSPQFAQDRYVTEVWEEQDAGTYVLQVSAHDIDSLENGEVRYYIDSGNTDRSFLIHDVTGIVTTALTLDREIHKEYKLTVYAYDLGAPRRTGSCTLKVTVVDINDHKPTLNVPARGSLSVSENVDIGTLITKVTANDPDLVTPTFQLASNKDNQNDYFTIDKQEGTIHLAKSLDYEMMHQAIIVVQATDGQHTDEKEIFLNIEDDNDNAPVFKQQSYQATLNELSPVNTTVTQVHADDIDSNNNGLITYTLIDTLPSKAMFVVDKYSGMIYTNMTESFNPQSSVYNLMILAEDHGQPSLNNTVSVRIQIKDVNNHSPLFGSESYDASVSESAERNTHVINITATDADFSKDNRHIYYKITSGNEGNAFKINTHTVIDGENTVGEICVANELDRENISEYQLTVTAYDEGSPQMSSETTVTVVIDDVNDNQPIFNQTSYEADIAEDAKQESVLTIFAMDPDSSSNLMFKITAGNDDSAFAIDECIPSYNGCANITANGLDYEQRTSYNLTVQVWDGRDVSISRSSIVTVKINILDVNEHPPFFVGIFRYLKEIPESVRPNQTLFWLPATDYDEGIYGDLYFTIINNKNSSNGCRPANQMFEIIQKTGEVRSRHEFDYETCQQYLFQVRVENFGEGNPRLAKSQPSSTLPIEINVEPVDEFPPLFSSLGDEVLYKFKVPYSATAGYVIGVVNATDKDAGVDGKISYEIDQEDQDQEFVINSTSGVISLSRRLDNTNNRVLTVSAISREQKARTLVTIEVEGAPAIAFEAQILSIVFGVIAGVAVVIVLILCIKHRRNKKAQSRPPNATASQIGNEGEFYDPATAHKNKNGIPIAAPRQINSANRNCKSASTRNSSEYQIRRTGSAHSNTANGILRHSVSTNGHAHAIENGNRSKSNSGAKISGNLSNGHVISRLSSSNTNGHVVQYRGTNSVSSGRGSTQDEDDVDKEVDRINSSSDITNNNSPTGSVPKPKIRRKLSGQGRHRKQVPDSGIQKDIDVESEISDGPINIRSPPSVESIHVFGDEGAGEEPLNIKDIEEDLETEFENGAKKSNVLSGMMKIPYSEDQSLTKTEIDSQYRSPLGTDSNKSSILSKRGGESIESGYSRRDHLTNWAPEFQPLANVFSEIAKLKDREAAARTANQSTFIMKDLSVPRTISQVQDPPPLITSVAEQRNNLVAPVPLGYTSNRLPAGRRTVGGNLMGLYPHSQPQYIRTGNNLPPNSYLSSLYTSALIRPVNTSSNNANITRPQVGFNLPQGNIGGLGASSINSSQQGLSVSSLPRTPISHESSFTSPAMSPNLTPSLSPLATRSPSVSTVGEGGVGMGYDTEDGCGSGLPLSRSDPNLAAYAPDDMRGREERMVHV